MAVKNDTQSRRRGGKSRLRTLAYIATILTLPATIALLLLTILPGIRAVMFPCHRM